MLRDEAKLPCKRTACFEISIEQTFKLNLRLIDLTSNQICKVVQVR
jgi:hypothetical protein